MTLLLLLCMYGPSNAQSSINQPGYVTDLMDDFIMHNKEASFKGWRLMVSLSRDRRSIELSKSRFERLFPEMNCELVFQDPYYKLVAGAFKEKKEAAVILNDIRKNFSSATEIIAEVTNKEVFDTMYGNRP